MPASLRAFPFSSERTSASTSWPAFFRRCATALPMYPLPPVRKIFMRIPRWARAVSEELKRELENFVPAEDLFYSRCFDDARSIARQVLDRGYGTVLTGGGDGTFVGYVNCLFEEAMARPNRDDARGAFKLAPVPMPSVRRPAC